MPSLAIERRESATFAITVDFVKGEGDPSRPFRTMVGLLDAFRRLDRDLARSFDIGIEPQLFLEDVETGSIKSWIATVLRDTSDEAIRSGDWKKVLGEYLVKAKYIVLDKLEDAPSITQPQLLETIQSELTAETSKTELGLLIGYTPLTRSQLAAHIADITTSLEPLRDGDRATFEGEGRAPVSFNPHLRVDVDEMNELLAARTIINESEMILKVKKPDFLGSSMWEFHFDGHAIQASIVDAGWLEQFRRDGLGVRPGVALLALVRVQVSYDDENEALPARYTVLKVREVIQPSPAVHQMALSSSPAVPELSAPPPADEPR